MLVVEIILKMLLGYLSGLLASTARISEIRQTHVCFKGSKEFARFLSRLPESLLQV